MTSGPKPTRLAYLCSDPGIPPDSSKGASVHFREMAQALRAAGADLDVFMARKGQSKNKSTDSKLSVVAPAKGKGVTREVQTLAASAAMLDAMAESGPHDAVYERLSLFGVAGLAYARSQEIPLVLEVNAPLWEEAARYRSLKMQATARAMAADVMTGADQVLTVSKELQRIVVTEGVESGKVQVMGNGVNRDLFENALPAKRPAMLADKAVVTFIGSLKPWHGIQFLLEAFEKCRSHMPVGLWIVGDGPLREAVEEAASLYPQEIFFQGGVEHELIPQILKASDVSVAPYPEDAPAYFCPLKVVEAMAVGCPLLASRTTCVTDVVGSDSDRPGLQLFSPGDVEDFRVALGRLLAEGSWAKNWQATTVPEELSWHGKAKRVLELIAALLVVLMFSACQGPEFQGGRTLADLAAGMWVEAEGDAEATGKVPTITEIEQVKPTSSSSPKKLEVTAKAQSGLVEDRFEIMGREVNVVDKTEYENLERKVVPRFPVSPGDWLRVKLRTKEENRLRARVIRKVEPRGQFQIQGAITAIDQALDWVEVGTIRLQAPQDTVVRLLGDRKMRIRAADDPLAVFLEDEQKSVPFSIHLTDWLFLGGGMRLKTEMNDEFDLEEARKRDRSNLSVEAKLDLLWVLDEQGSFALFEGGMGRKDRFETLRRDTTTRSQNLSRAYAYYRFSELLRAQVGRQDFDDEREWLYDEVLDGLRLHSSVGAFDLEFSASAGREFAEEEGNETEETLTYMALGRYRFSRKHRVTAYGIQRRNTSGQTDKEFDNLTLLGLRSYEKPSRGLGHWLELAFATGDAGTDDIDGVAFDVGLFYRSRWPLRPTFVLGYAYATGKRPGSGEIGFLQTGIQDNNSKFGGLTSFKYYGEVLEPELANMDITSVGIGIRPMSSFSLDLMLHSYRQDYKSTILYDSKLRTEPNGVFSALGWEADLIAGYRLGSRMRAEFVLGRFDPGVAFDNQDEAHKVEFQIDFKF